MISKNILCKTRRRSKTPECFFHKFGNMNGSSIFQIGANDLNPDGNPLPISSFSWLIRE